MFIRNWISIYGLLFTTHQDARYTFFSFYYHPQKQKKNQMEITMGNTESSPTKRNPTKMSIRFENKKKEAKKR